MPCCWPVVWWRTDRWPTCSPPRTSNAPTASLPWCWTHDRETVVRAPVVLSGRGGGGRHRRRRIRGRRARPRSEEHTSELQSRENLVCRLLLEKKKNV